MKKQKNGDMNIIKNISQKNIFFFYMYHKISKNYIVTNIFYIAYKIWFKKEIFSISAF